jgi:hypothetical protein
MDRAGGGGVPPTFWPPPSLDLTALDFFLWGFVKDEVYVTPVPITPNNLKGRTQTATAKTAQSLLKNVWHEVENRLDVLRAANGKKSLQWCAFSFYVAVTILPIRLCNLLTSFVITLYFIHSN